VICTDRRRAEFAGAVGSLGLREGLPADFPEKKFLRRSRLFVIFMNWVRRTGAIIAAGMSQSRSTGKPWNSLLSFVIF
jgi:hypothetical protein